MIAHQAVGEGLGDGLNVSAVQVQEVGVVPRFSEEGLTVDTTIVDVIVGAWLERFWMGHGCIVRSEGGFRKPETPRGPRLDQSQSLTAYRERRAEVNSAGEHLFAPTRLVQSAPAMRGPRLDQSQRLTSGREGRAAVRSAGGRLSAATGLVQSAHATRELRLDQSQKLTIGRGARTEVN